jgi:hypothetical protein
MSASPTAVSAAISEGSGRYFHMASLSVLNNTFVNFPKNGKELQVTTNPAYNPNYTHAGNTIASGSESPAYFSPNVQLMRKEGISDMEDPYRTDVRKKIAEEPHSP